MLCLLLFVSDKTKVGRPSGEIKVLRTKIV